jgi:RNA recognition motif-containing protein
MPKLFIVGFPKSMHEIELVEMFSLQGTVDKVTVVTDKATGESKCYGFVTMADDSGAKRAICGLDGTQINGRRIQVRFAEEKPPVRQNNQEAFIEQSSPNRLSQQDKLTGAVKFKRPRRPQ